MTTRTVKLFNIWVVGLMLVLLPEQAYAQNPATTDSEALKHKVEQQEKLITQLQLNLQEQSRRLEQQQAVLDSLQQKLTPTITPTPVSAVVEKPAPAAPLAERKTTDSTAVAKPAAKAPQDIEVGFGKVKFNGLIQAWYASGDRHFDSFRIRRALFRFTGEINPHIKWNLMIDPAKLLTLNDSFTTVNAVGVVNNVSLNQSSRLLQDAFITLDYSKHVKVDIGQFKLPLGLESLQPSARLDTVERALMHSDRLRNAFGNLRDLGLMARGPLGAQVDYQFGVFNGTGENQNDLDKNDQKAIVGRLVARPRFIKGLQFGISGAWSNGSQPDRPRHDRSAAELLYSNRNFTFKSEVMAGLDDTLHRIGYYTHFGYKVTPKIEAVFRYDVWDPNTRLDTNASNAAERDYLVGFNYFIHENNVKFQLNYIRKTFVLGLSPSRNLVLANLQTSW
ncbi:MAG: hypothetical protein HY231_07260 [Acidobacteria bacterium]|nr:hypothetical protein [Acidobacteriota bacterium]